MSQIPAQSPSVQPHVTVRFRSDWSEEATGRIGPGTEVTIEYEKGRLPPNIRSTWMRVNVDDVFDPSLPQAPVVKEDNELVVFRFTVPERFRDKAELWLEASGYTGWQQTPKGSQPTGYFSWYDSDFANDYRLP